jgi:hypothetical protein
MHSIGVCIMRSAKAPRSLAIGRRPAAVQPAAILGTIGMIVTLTLVWAGLVSAWPGVH